MNRGFACSRSFLACLVFIFFALSLSLRSFLHDELPLVFFFRAVPLAPILRQATEPRSAFASTDTESAASTPTTTTAACLAENGTPQGEKSTGDQVVPPPPTVVTSEFRRSLEAFQAGADDVSTLQLLDLLLDKGALSRIPHMFNIGMVRRSGSNAGTGGTNGAHGIYGASDEPGDNGGGGESDSQREEDMLATMAADVLRHHLEAWTRYVGLASYIESVAF